jgi:anti-sigma factor RsiW
MDHKEVLELLPAYLDQELGVVDAIAVERHLAGCAECQIDLAQQKAISSRLSQDATRFFAPSGLAQRISEGLPRAASPSAGIKSRGLEGWRASIGAQLGNLGWLGAGALAASVLALVGSTSLYLARPSDQERLTEALISSHVRSLQVNHLSDVASTDKHTVKPWFNGKLDFSPPVVDLAAQDFALEGGRLDYVEGRTVAVLIYRHAQHPINLFVWPSSDADAAPRTQDRQGYHLIGWTSHGMKYWAVSELASGELNAFVAALRLQG